MARLPFLLTPQGAALKGKAKGRDRTLLPGCGKPRITICDLVAPRCEGATSRNVALSRPVGVMRST